MMQKCLACHRPHDPNGQGVVRLGSLGIVCVVQLGPDGSYHVELARKVWETGQKGTLDVTGSYDRATAEKVRRLLIASRCIAYLGQVREVGTLPILLPGASDRQSLPTGARL